MVAQTETLNLALPTDNDALFRGDGPEFYQYIERDFKGEKSNPWEGGQYGFVRNPNETPAGIVYTRFHEGIDIRPLQRDARGEPLDGARDCGWPWCHTNLVPVPRTTASMSWSNIAGTAGTTTASTGICARLGSRRTARAAGEQLGVMGHTGEGLDQARAHVHLELNLMLSRRFESWHDHLSRTIPIATASTTGSILPASTSPALSRLAETAVAHHPGVSRRRRDVLQGAASRLENFDLPERYPWMLARKRRNSGVMGSLIQSRGCAVEDRAERETGWRPELSYVKDERN